jgi:hypothetical protein
VRVRGNCELDLVLFMWSFSDSQKEKKRRNFMRLFEFFLCSHAFERAGKFRVSQPFLIVVYSSFLSKKLKRRFMVF